MIGGVILKRGLLESEHPQHRKYEAQCQNPKTEKNKALP